MFTRPAPQITCLADIRQGKAVVYLRYQSVSNPVSSPKQSILRCILVAGTGLMSSVMEAAGCASDDPIRSVPLSKRETPILSARSPLAAKHTNR